MDLARIRELLNIVAESGVAEVEVEEDGVKVVVRKNAATVMVQQAPQPFSPFGANYPPPAYPPMPAPVYPQAVAPAPVAPMPVPTPAPTPATAPVAAATIEEAKEEAPEEGVIVHAPIVGTFYEAPAPNAQAFVKVGDTIQPGDVLCIIEAMKLMNEIESEVAGTVRKVLAVNAEPVEYDQPLFLIEAA